MLNRLQRYNKYFEHTNNIQHKELDITTKWHEKIFNVKENIECNGLHYLEGAYDSDLQDKLNENIIEFVFMGVNMLSMYSTARKNIRSSNNDILKDILSKEEDYLMEYNDWLCYIDKTGYYDTFIQNVSKNFESIENKSSSKT